MRKIITSAAVVGLVALSPAIPASAHQQQPAQAAALHICHRIRFVAHKVPVSYVYVKIKTDTCRRWPHGWRLRAAGQCITVTGLHWRYGNWVTRSKQRDGGGQLSKAYCSLGEWNDFGYDSQYARGWHVLYHSIDK